ncbi:IS21-like element helper ATPase IstB [Mucilaginibacter sp. Mucisp84]|uniref:IS21-like element helper ATPase IstB n=1 Tax=Mucilaginibacter sp. Mucisp84 TaxID=3243058 RepID=UPI0039A72D03
MNTSTLDKLRKMKFFGMFHAFKSSMETGKTNDYTADELLAHLVEAEWDDRQNRRIDRTIQYAKFRYKAAIEDVHYHADRTIDRNQIMRLADCTFIDRFENLLITGSTGIGKSYVASAIGHQACILGYRVLYTSTPKLFAKLKMAKADGSYIKELAKLERTQVLILDDFGIQPFDAQSRAALMEIIEDRHGKTSLIITSQLPVSKWFEVIGEKTIADAILDRIVLYTSTPKLFAKLKMAKADGSYIKELAKLERTQVLILDDFGIQPFDAQSRAALMEIIEDRHGKTSLIITSQLPVSKWFEVIGEKTIADAILDRIVHDAHRIELKGESMRKKRSIEPVNSL